MKYLVQGMVYIFLGMSSANAQTVSAQTIQELQAEEQNLPKSLEAQRSEFAQDNAKYEVCLAGCRQQPILQCRTLACMTTAKENMQRCIERCATQTLTL